MKPIIGCAGINKKRKREIYCVVLLLFLYFLLEKTPEMVDGVWASPDYWSVDFGRSCVTLPQKKRKTLCTHCHLLSPRRYLVHCNLGAISAAEKGRLTPLSSIQPIFFSWEREREKKINSTAVPVNCHSCFSAL